MGGGELVLIFVSVLMIAGLGILAVGLAVALAMRLTRKQTEPHSSFSPSPHLAAPVQGPKPAKEHASLAGSRFHSVNLTGAEFDDVNLSNARFSNVDLSNAVITTAHLGGAAFKHVGPPPDAAGAQARQRPVRFEQMMLCDSTFRKVDLSNVRITECDVTGMTIDGILVTDLMSAFKKQEEGGGRDAAEGAERG